MKKKHIILILISILAFLDIVWTSQPKDIVRTIQRLPVIRDLYLVKRSEFEGHIASVYQIDNDLWIEVDTTIDVLPPAINYDEDRLNEQLTLDEIQFKWWSIHSLGSPEEKVGFIVNVNRVTPEEVALYFQVRYVDPRLIPFDDYRYWDIEDYLDGPTKIE